MRELPSPRETRRELDANKVNWLREVRESTIPAGRQAAVVVVKQRMDTLLDFQAWYGSVKR